MPLVNLKTDLKSLKYGQDRSGGGNSSQPYIQNDINNPKNILGFDDGFIRGGAVGAAKSSVNDTLRISKFLIDTPHGPLFIAKQVGLQLSNPKQEFKAIPNIGVGGFLGGLLNTGINILNKNHIGPNRIYNLGLNTIAEIPVTAFGVHFNRHGPLPVQTDDTKYFSVVKYNNENNQNRLVLLKNKLVGKDSFGVNIDDYIGGPDSVYGIGRTVIRRYDTTRTESQGIIDKTNPYQVKPKATFYRHPEVKDNKNPYQPFIGVNYSSSLGVSNDYFGGANYNSDAVLRENNISNNGKAIAYPTATVYSSNNALGKYAELQNKLYNQQTNGSDYLATLKSKGLNRETRIGSGKQDSINLTPLFSSNVVGTFKDRVIINGKKHNIQDLVKFRIQSLNTDDPTQKNVWMIFRAYLTQFTDSVDASWNEVKYAGRGDKFYIYEGFGRKINIGFKVAALSAQEMEPMYQKLNYLMSNLMPDYENNLMRGPLVRMTVGNWIDGQLGKLDSISYSIPQDSPWEISLGDKELNLPHVIEVTMTFTPIGSQTRDQNLISSKSATTSNIAQNWNGASEREYIYPDVTKVIKEGNQA